MFSRKKLYLIAKDYVLFFSPSLVCLKALMYLEKCKGVNGWGTLSEKQVACHPLHRPLLISDTMFFKG